MKTINVNLRGGQAEGTAAGISFSFSGQEVLVHTAGSREAALAIPVVDHPLLSQQVFRFQLSGYQVELEVLEVIEEQTPPLIVDEILPEPPIEPVEETDSEPFLVAPIAPDDTDTIEDSVTETWPTDNGGDKWSSPEAEVEEDSNLTTATVSGEGNQENPEFPAPNSPINAGPMDPRDHSAVDSLSNGNSKAEELQGLVARYEALLRQHNLMQDDALVG